MSVHRTSLALVLLTVAVGWLAPRSARADASEDARELFQRGVEAYEGGRYPAARELYARSYALKQRPRTLFNLAVTEDKLGLIVDAYEHYVSFLAIAEARDAALKPKAEQRVAVLGAILAGSLEVTSVPPGAAVFVDGSTTRAATTPAILRLAPGRHALRLALRGRRPVERMVLIAPRGTHREQLVLTRGVSTLRIRVNVPAASVRIDGVVVGTSGAGTPFARELEPGRAVLEVEKAGYTPFRGQLSLLPEAVNDVSVTLGSRRARWATITGWGLIGLGGAALGTGAGFGIVALNETSESRAQLADGLFITGAASTVAGVVLLLLTRDRASTARFDEVD